MMLRTTGSDPNACRLVANAWGWTDFAEVIAEMSSHDDRHHRNEMPGLLLSSYTATS